MKKNEIIKCQDEVNNNISNKKLSHVELGRLGAKARSEKPWNDPKFNLRKSRKHKINP